MHRTIALTMMFSAAMLMLGTAAAFADPAAAKSGVNVRSGPGTDFAKLGTLKTGEVVEVEECKGAWCFVDRQSGKDGWVAANYLEPVAIKDDADEDDTDVPVNFGITVGPGGPTVSFGIGNPPPAPPAPPPSSDKACFYTGVHFTGASACVAIGASSTFLIPGWDNEVESFKIIGTGKVEICRDTNFGGGCVVYSSTQSSLPVSYANNVSSYQTYY